MPQPMMAHIQIKHALEASSDLVMADPNQLKQVFINIILNAADAMGEDKLQEDAPSDKMLTIKSKNKGDLIELWFSDNGPGIDPDSIEHIFDPFYTSKDPGKGTGLGLSVCYSIIDGLGGEIRAESTPGKGATIVVGLPVVNI